MEGCEAFFVAFEVDPNFSGIVAIPRDDDKSVVVIVEDVNDSKYVYRSQTCRTVHQYCTGESMAILTYSSTASLLD